MFEVLYMRGKKFEFNEEQIKYIIDNWGKETPHSMKKSLVAVGMQYVVLQKVTD